MAPRRPLLGIFVLALCAQGAPAENNITLNVIVRDSHDQPVTDLTAADFQVSDQGKSQHILNVRPPEDHRQLQEKGPVKIAPHAVLILFDLLNANLSYRGYGADQIVNSLQKLESSDLVFLYLLTNNGSLYPMHGLPGPDQDNRPVNGPWTQDIKPRMEEALRQVFGLKPIDDKIPSNRVEAAYRALDTLGAQLSRIQGRKDVIWISQGVPIRLRMIDGQEFEYTPRLQRLAGGLDRAGITVNTVDQGDALSTGSKDTLEEFAALTGGKAYPTGTVEKAIPEVLESPRATYEIQYAAPEPDKKFHKVKVTTSRKGVHLQAEQGYVGVQ